MGQNAARQALIKAGLPVTVPGTTINKVCGSGLKAVMLAAQAIANGDAEIVVAGGQENMSASPHVMKGSRDGYRMGDAKIVDSMIVDGLWDVYNQYHMGITAENVAKEHKAIARRRISSRWPRSRKRQPRRTRAASRKRLSPCRFRRGRVTRSHSMPTSSSIARPTEALSGLKPAFDKQGTDSGQRVRTETTAPPHCW